MYMCEWVYVYKYKYVYFSMICPCFEEVPYLWSDIFLPCFEKQNINNIYLISASSKNDIALAVSSSPSLLFENQDFTPLISNSQQLCLTNDVMNWS